MIWSSIHLFWRIVNILTHQTELLFCLLNKQTYEIVVFLRNSDHGVFKSIHHLRWFLNHYSTVLVNHFDLLIFTILCSFFNLLLLFYLYHFSHNKVFSLIPFINQFSSKIYLIILKSPLEKLLHNLSSKLSYFRIHPFLRNHANGHTSKQNLILWN